MPTDDRSTIDLLRGSRITSYGIGLVSLLAGLLLMFWPDRTAAVVGVILGVLFLVSGFAQSADAVTTHRKGSAWGFLLLRGVINIAFGLVLIFWTGAASTAIVWLIGLNFVLTGALALIASFLIDKEMSHPARPAQHRHRHRSDGLAELHQVRRRDPHRHRADPHRTADAGYRLSAVEGLESNGLIVHLYR